MIWMSTKYYSVLWCTSLVSDLFGINLWFLLISAQGWFTTKNTVETTFLDISVILCYSSKLVSFTNNACCWFMWSKRYRDGYQANFPKVGIYEPASLVLLIVCKQIWKKFTYLASRNLLQCCKVLQRMLQMLQSSDAFKVCCNGKLVSPFLLR